MWIKSLIIAVALTGLVASAIPILSDRFVPKDNSNVMTHTVSRGDVLITVTETGMLESSNNEEIKCMVKGGSTVLWVIETGTFVKPGDELVRLDTSLIEDNITQQQINYERAVANRIIAHGEVEVAQTNIEEYLNGTFQEERNSIEKLIFDAEELVKKSQLRYESSMRLASKGMFRSLQMEGEKFAVDSARKDLELKKKQLETLDRYKKKKTLQELQSALDAAKARLAAEEASLKLEKDRLDREKEQLKNCVIRATAEGMVIFPSAAEWKETPDIEEGAIVREQQTLLMIPDVSKMQVKVGVHESKVGRLRIGMPARVELQDLELEGTVSEIAEVTRPAGWWTGNMVKYDTLIRLDPQPGLKPGMSAVVDIVLAEYRDVIKVPVAAIMDTGQELLCWVKKGDGFEKRQIQVGDTNDEFTVVESGLAEGDEVVLNPTAFLDEAQMAAMRPTPDAASESDAADPADGATKNKAAPKGNRDSKIAPANSDKTAHAANGKSTTADGNAKNEKGTSGQQGMGARIVAGGDNNGDGVLTIDEFQEKDRANFSQVDTNSDGKVTPQEIDAAIKTASEQ